MNVIVSQSFLFCASCTATFQTKRTYIHWKFRSCCKCVHNNKPNNNSRRKELGQFRESRVPPHSPPSHSTVWHRSKCCAVHSHRVLSIYSCFSLFLRQRQRDLSMQSWNRLKTFYAHTKNSTKKVWNMVQILCASSVQQPKYNTRSRETNVVKKHPTRRNLAMV